MFYESQCFSFFLSLTLLESLLSISVPEDNALKVTDKDKTANLITEAGWGKKFVHAWNATVDVASQIVPVVADGIVYWANGGSSSGCGGAIVPVSDPTTEIFVNGSSATYFRYHVAQTAYGCTLASDAMYLSVIRGSQIYYNDVYDEAKLIPGWSQNTVCQRDLINHYSDNPKHVYCNRDNPTFWVPHLAVDYFAVSSSNIDMGNWVFQKLVKALSLPLSAYTDPWGYFCRPGIIINFSNWNGYQHSTFAFGAQVNTNDITKYDENIIIYVADSVFQQGEGSEIAVFNIEKLNRFKPTHAVYPNDLN